MTELVPRGVMPNYYRHQASRTRTYTYVGYNSTPSLDYPASADLSLPLHYIVSRSIVHSEFTRPNFTPPDIFRLCRRERCIDDICHAPP